MKGLQMKTMKYISNCMALSTMVLAIVTLTWLPAYAQDTNGAPMKPMKGGEHMMMLNKPITTKAQADELKPGDSVAMVCTKCKTVSTEFITKESKDNVTTITPGEKHLCPGCDTTM